MRRTRPERRSARRTRRGFTLVEVVVVIVMLAIISVVVVIFGAQPVRQAVDIALRADLTDVADNTLQRIGREVRLAVPNSVRVTVSGSLVLVEFLAVRTAGRYRADTGSVSGGVDCPNTDTALGMPGNDLLSFDTVADTCFKTIGKLPNGNLAVATDFLVLNNYGPGFSGQDAYATAGVLNRAALVAVNTAETGRDRVQFAATTFQRALHDSAGRRFFITSGPVSYACDTAARTLTRYSGYAIAAAQPVTFGGASAALIANEVSACAFEYSPGVAPQIGLLTLRLALTRARVDGTSETVSLYHAIHVSNVP